MKKLGKIIGLSACLISFLCVSCATLQNDIFISTEDNAYIYSSIEYYETSFIKTDCSYQLDSASTMGKVNSLLSEITEYIASSKLAEPVIIARLTAIKGLLLEMSGNKSESNTCYRKAKTLQATDRYVLLLKVRLEKDDKAKLEACKGILDIDAKNPVILLEAAKILIRTSSYKNAVAKMDEASLLFDNENLEIYNEVYKPLRDYAWNMYSISNGKTKIISQENLSTPLTVKSMVELGFDNSTLFDNYKSSAKQNIEKKIQVLTDEKYFNSPSDYNGLLSSSKEILESQNISRRFCARFLWNTFVKRQGKPKLLTKYSDRYKASGRAMSPVADVSVYNPDFDAILGVVENEIMELPDGKNFYPDDIVSKLDYLKWIKKIEK
ncbi:hypothetical protein [Treponema sp. C6A8]|uniref:hypothetical protein n=1 Tax=Treponema sp. C6A8 TaxID=1410609 RepID=UPI0004891E91|nr:hypothetical protein [Treponema sp. C6A8]